MKPAEFHSSIPVVPSDVKRPLWSVMIPTYNCARFLRETLESVLQQDPGPDQMQIEVIDDYSTKDDPEAVVREFGRNRVTFYRQPANVGIIKNFETCLRRSRGQLIHQLHGDDVVLPGFYRQMATHFTAHPEIGMAFCKHAEIDEHSRPQDTFVPEPGPAGILDDWLERIAVKQQIQTATVVVRRDVYETLGGFDRRLTRSEDWEMWVRIALHYPVSYEPTLLALYRRHSTSSTTRGYLNGDHVRVWREALKVVRSKLPADKADRLHRAARRNLATYDLESARRLFRSRQFGPAFTYLREALCCDSSLPGIWAVIRQCGQAGLYWVQRVVQKAR